MKALVEEDSEVDQKPVLIPMTLKVPFVPREPPGSAENPLLFVAPVFGELHKPLVDFRAPPATDEPPKVVSNELHSASLGKCQPVGQIPRTLPVNGVGSEAVLLAPFWYCTASAHWYKPP